MTFFTKRGMRAAGAAGVLILAALGAWYYTARAYVPSFPIRATDHIASWSFTSAYTGNETLLAQGAADAAKLSALLGKGAYDDYDLHVGIGNDALLAGDGKAAYAEYNRAVKIHPKKALAYANLGHLMDELGAYGTAADAYAKATAVEPRQLQYHVERLDFLTRRFPQDNALIRSAITDASAQFGDTPAVLAIEAQWLEGQGRYANAIQAWQTVKLLSPENRQASLDAQIARDRLKARAQ